MRRLRNWSAGVMFCTVLVVQFVAPLRAETHTIQFCEQSALWGVALDHCWSHIAGTSCDAVCEAAGYDGPSSTHDGGCTMDGDGYGGYVGCGNCYCQDKLIIQ